MLASFLKRDLKNLIQRDASPNFQAQNGLLSLRSWWRSVRSLEMVVAIAVWHLRKFCRDSRHEGVLLVRHPEDHALAQNLGPLLGLSDQALNLWGRCRE